MKPSATRRERVRAETRAAIRELGTAQIAGGGPDALSLSGIARELGMSAPALYRYIPSRDALLARLVADVFVSLADAIGVALADMRPGGERRLRALAGAFRDWALAHPRQYALVTKRVPDVEGRSEMLVASTRALDYVISALRDLDPQISPDDAQPAAPRPEAPAWLREFAVAAWQRMHGHLALELEGLHDVLGIEPAALYDDEVAAIARDGRFRWASERRAVSR